MKKVLIVVDMQNDFIWNTDVLGSEAAQKIVPNVVAKVEEYRKNNDIVVFTQDCHGEDYLQTREGRKLPIEHCFYKTKGWKIIPEITVEKDDLILYKFDQFGLGIENLDFYLERVTGCSLGEWSFEIIGIATNLCVLSVAITLQNYYTQDEITIDASCCASYDPILHEKALDVMEGLQFNVINR